MSLEGTIIELEAQKKEVGDNLIKQLGHKQYSSGFALYKEYRQLQNYIEFLKKYSEKTNKQQGQLFNGEKSR